MKTPYNWAKRDQIHSLLRMLDVEVTGKSDTHKSHQDFPDDFEFGGVEYHLSDGRSSVRFELRVGPLTGHLFMTTNSSPDARKKFTDLRTLRAVIETFSLCGGVKE